MSLATFCVPRPSVFEKDRRANVLDLDELLKERIAGREFFRENYFTTGMATLVERCFRHLSGGQAGSSVFHLSQSMGGGKTHSMIALGLLGRDPALRKEILGNKNPAPDLGKVKVVGFSGRNSDAPLGIWGSIAEQLGRKDQFSNYYSPLAAPGPEAWKTLLAGQPVIVLLDELPPYMEDARSKAIGNSDLSVVTTTALSNLLVAATQMDTVCIVLSDLGGRNYQAGSALLHNALANLRDEAGRVALPITPVNPQGDELYHILRCRLFERLPESGSTEIAGVADEYRKSHATAVSMKLTESSSEGFGSQVADSYPFHPCWRDLVGRFKENEGFQQTRGVIRLMQMVVANIWTTNRASELDLLAPYDLDLGNDEIASELRSINQNLSEAMSHDIAHDGNGESEQIDGRNGNSDASDAARLILIASLSTTPGSTHGLREFELYNYLARPGRDLSSLKSKVLDVLELRAWYLHRSQDDRLFFKNQQNLAAKLRSTALGLDSETVNKELKKHLADRFEPRIKDCYQSVEVLPALDEVQLDQDRILLVIAEAVGGHNGLALSENWQGWWANQSFKNRVLFLTGSRQVMQNVKENTRQYRALQSIEDELRHEATPAGDPQWKALDSLRDRVHLQLSASLTEAFDTLIFPSINAALRSNAVRLEFKGNSWRGEDVMRATLKEAQKFTEDVGVDSFRQKVEARLFGSRKQIPWSEVRREAASLTTWQFHSPRALDDLKNDCLRKNVWIEQGNFIEKGPFPKAETSLVIRELSRSDDGTTWLRLEPLHGDVVHFETGANDPTAASTKVSDFQRFEAKGLLYRFLCVDSTGGHPTGSVLEWKGRVELKYGPKNPRVGSSLSLQATPSGTIRYSTDGTSSRNGATYAGPFEIRPSCRVVLAVAECDGIASDELRIEVSQEDGPTGPILDATAPCVWKKRFKFDDTASVWNVVSGIEEHGVLAEGISLNASTSGDVETLEYQGIRRKGYDGAALRFLCDQMQSLLDGGDLRLKIQKLHFATGQDLLDWVNKRSEGVDPSEVEQGGLHG